MTTRRAIKDLLPETMYSIRVRATNETETSQWSQKLTFTTISDDVRPSTPQNITWVPTGDSFHAEWDAVTTNVALDKITITRYEIEVGANGIQKVVSVPATTGSRVSYDLSFEENRAYFGEPQATVSFRVRAVDNKDLKSYYSEIVFATNGLPEPPGPITGVAGADQIMLTWEPSPDNDIAAYRLHVGLSSDFIPNESNKIFEGNALSYSYTTTTYTGQWFKVYAIDKFGQVSATYSATADAITPVSPFVVDIDAPPGPASVTVSTGYDEERQEASVDVSWSAVAADDLAKYTVRYGPSETGPWTYVDADKDVTSTRVYTTAGVDLYVGVRAEDWAANKSLYTNASTYPIITAADTTPPPQTTGLVVTPQGTSFVSTWTASIAADLDKYEIGINYSGGTEVFYKISGTRFDFTLEMNRAAFTTPKGSIQVRVRAIDKTGNEGAWSTVVTATNPAPNPPTGLVAGIGANSINLRWTASTSDDVAYYNIYQNTTPNPTVKVAEVLGTNITIIVNTSAQYFTVKAVDVFGQESSAVNIGPVTGNNPFLVDTTPPAAPATVAVTTGYDTTRKEAYLDVSWAAVASDLALYTIRYGSSTSGPWTYMNADKDVTSTRIYVTPGVGYYVGVRAEDYASNKSAYTNASTYPITAGADSTAPAQVTGLAVNAVGTSFIATWTAATDNDFKEYEVGVNYSGGTEVFYRQNGTRFDFTLERNRSAFTTPRAAVQIRVRAIDFANNAGTWSSTVTGTNSAPSAPTALVSSLGANSITLSWTASSATGDIVGYNVYQGTSASPTTKVAFGDSTTFTTTVGTVAQYFTIKAVDAFGQESAALNGGPFTAPNPYIVDNVAPAVPTITSASLFNIASSKSSSLAVAWNAVGDSDLQGYVVRYLKNGSSVWTQVNVSKDETGIFIEGLVPYVSYGVQIRSFDYNGNYSAWSATTTATAPANAVPANVTGLTALPGKDNIAYSWQPVADLDIKNYELTFSTSSTFASGNVQYLTGNSTNVSVSGLAPGTTYYARVRAIDEGGNTSAAWSSTVSSTTVAYGTYTSDGAAPTSSPAAVVSAGIGNLFINWNAVANNDPVIYEVHISTVAGFTPTAGGATRITEVSGTSAVLEKYTDGNPLSYTTPYYVRIIAKDKDGAAAPGTVGSGSPAKALGADIGAVIGGENLFSNTEFNGTTTPWVARGTGVTASLETTNVLNPNVNSAKVTMGSTLQSDWGLGPTSSLHYVPVQPNTTYTVSAWFKADSGTPKAYIHSRFYQSDKTTFVTAVSTANTPINATGWTRITSTFTTGASTYWMISIFGCANGSTIFYVTQPQLEVGDVATQWQKSTSELATKLNQTESVSQSSFLNSNQNFTDWPVTSTYPTGYSFIGSGSTRETTIVKTLPNAVRMQTTANTSLYFSCAANMSTVAESEYITYEVDFYLVSGDLVGTGVLIDWGGYNGSYIRVSDNWSVNVPVYTVGKWNRVTRTVKRPTITSGAFTGMNALFMAGYTGGGFGGTVSVKDIIVDRMGVRPATAQEIQAYEANGYTDTVVATSASGKNKVTYSTSLPGTTANIAGDTWFVRDASTGVIIAQYEGTGGTSWISRQLRNEVISSLDVGKLLSGSIASADIQVASTGAIRSTDYAAGATGWKLSTAGLEVNSGVISGQTIKAATIDTSKLVISDLTNLFPNPMYFNNGSDWVLSGPATITIVADGPTQNHVLMTKTGSGESQFKVNPLSRIKVTEGDKHYVQYEIWLDNSSMTTGGGNSGMYARCYNTAGTFTGSLNILTQSVASLTDTPTVKSGTFTIPAGVAWIEPDFYMSSSTVSGTASHYRSPILRRMASAELIVDGSITANKLNIKLGGDNLIANSSFESTSAPLGAAGNGATIVTSTDVSYRGTRSIKLTTGASSYPYHSVSTMLAETLKPNTTYTFTAWVWNPAVNTVTNNLYVQALGTGVATQTIQTLITVPTEVWTPLRCVFTTNNDAIPAVTLITVMNTPASAGKVFYIGALKLEESDVGSTYSPRADEILPGTINANMMQANSITVGNAAIADGTIITAKINDAAITTAKIADANITNAKIADLAVTNAKIADATITNAKISDLSVAKLTAGTVGSGVGITMASGSSILLNGGHLRSNTYNGGTSYSASATAGFYLGNDGLRIAQGAISASTLTTGTISATSITLGSTGIIQSTNYSAGATGWQLSQNGLEINGGVIRAAALAVTTGGMNLVRNSHFGSTAAITTTHAANGAATIAYDTSENYWGTPGQSARITSTGSSNTGIIYSLPIADLKLSTSYLFTFYAKIPSSGGVSSVNTIVFSMPGSGNVSSAISTNIPVGTTTTGQWVRLGVKFTTPASWGTITSYNIYAYNASTSTAGQYFNTDAWQIEEGDFVSAYSPRADEILPGTVSGNAIQANTLNANTLQANTAINQNLNVTGTLTLGTASSGSSGNIRSFAYTAGSVGWNINYAGDAEFNNVTVRGNLQGNSSSVITGGTYLTAANVGVGGGPAGLKLDSTGIKGYSGGTAETFSVLSASGNVNIAGTNAIGGNTTVSGTTSLGGTLTVAGGISVTGSAGTAYIRGGGFAGTTSAGASGNGYILDVNGLYIGPGSSISAGALNIQSGNNLMPSIYAGAETVTHTSLNGATISFDTTNYIQGTRATRVVYAGGAASRGVMFSDNVAANAISVEQGKTYFVSAWALNNTTTPTTLAYGYIDQSNNFTSVGMSQTSVSLPSSTSGWTRIYSKFTAPVGVTSIRPYLIQPGTDAFDFTIDALQVEEKFGSSVPGPWIAPGATTIDGAQIRTGAIVSNSSTSSQVWDGTANTWVNSTQPTWSIDTNGNAVFYHAQIRGDLVIGNTGDAVTSQGIVRSQNWSYTSPTDFNGWAIEGNGDVFFNNGIFKGNIIATSGTFSGTITSTADIQGGTITGGVIRTSSSANITGGVIIDNTGLKAYSGSNQYFTVDDTGLTLSGGLMTLSNSANLNLNGGNITVTTGYIRGGGNTGTSQTSAIAAGTGYFMNQEGLVVAGVNNKVYASSLQLQVGQNIAPNPIASMEFPSSYYFVTGTSLNTNDNITLDNYSSGGLSITTAQARYGTQSLLINQTNTSSRRVQFAGVVSGAPVNNIDIPDSGYYIISMWVRPNITNPLVIRTYDGNGQISSATAETASGSTSLNINQWNRVSVVAYISVAKIHVELVTPSAVGQWYVDGIQAEKLIGSLYTPSEFSLPSTTVIDGGTIKAGALRSTNDVTIDGQQKPIWSIPFNGAATFSGMNVYGNVVVGNSATDSTTQMASSNFSPGSAGWRIRGNGQAEFNDVTVRGAITGSTITGSTFTSTWASQKIVINSGAIEGYSGFSGESPSMFNPATYGGRPSLSVSGGSSSSYPYSGRLLFMAGSSGTGYGTATLTHNHGNIEIDAGGLTSSYGVVSIRGNAGVNITSTYAGINGGVYISAPKTTIAGGNLVLGVGNRIEVDNIRAANTLGATINIGDSSTTVNMPGTIKQNTDSINLSTVNVANSKSITFGTAFSSSGPVPTISIQTMGVTGNVFVSWSVSNVTRSGFTVHGIRNNGTGTTNFSWTAIAQ